MSGDDRDAFLRRFAARLGLPSDAPAEEFERVISERLGFAGWDLDWAFRWSMERMGKPQPERDHIRVVQQDPPQPAATRSLARPARQRPKGRR